MHHRLLLAVVIVAAALVAAAQASAATPGLTACRTFQGPAWKLPTKQGTTYVLSVRGISCTAATVWSKRLVAKSMAGLKPPAPLPGGPAGYTCQTIPDLNKHAHAGSCATKDFRHGFTWGPKA